MVVIYKREKLVTVSRIIKNYRVSLFGLKCFGVITCHGAHTLPIQNCIINLVVCVGHTVYVHAYVWVAQLNNKKHHKKQQKSNGQN